MDVVWTEVYPMRENMGIYRGKRKDTGEWVEGNLIESDNSHYPMVLIGHVIMSRDKHTDELSFDGFDLCEVDPSTVGQFTGLLDKNGNRIFEGDVVKYTFDMPDNPNATENGKKVIIGRVFFSDWRASFSVTAGRNCSSGLNNDLFKYVRNGNRVEVIGNIHDNRELLKEE